MASDLFERALGLHRQGKLQQAKAAYEQLLARQPRHFDALHLSGVLAYQSGDSARALQLIGKALVQRPGHAGAHGNLGLAQRAAGLPDAALASFERAVALDAKDADLHYNRGNALQALGRLDESIQSYDHAIALNARHANAHYNRAIALQGLRRLDEALAGYDACIAVAPNHAHALANRGLVLCKLARPQDALASCDRALAIDLASADAHINRGLALHALGRLGEACASFDAAIALRPDDARPHWNKALALLLAGDYAPGWALYEYRWKNDETKHHRRDFAHPLWLGDTPLAGKTILLHAEQGLGDTIQFCRYAKHVAELGARVILQVQPSLLPFLGSVEGVAQLVGEGNALPAFDLHCPLLSLPHALRASVDCIPSHVSYLTADAVRVGQWQQRLGPRQRPRVGLAWSGAAGHDNDRNRSIGLAELLRHLPAGVDYISLQKDLRPADAAVIAGSALRHFGDDLRDFADTAALCELMDVVISVDTSVAHLAGALGRPAWVLLPHAPDWRWLLGTDRSPWYPTARLYRQGADGAWAGVLDRLAVDVAALVAR